MEQTHAMDRLAPPVVSSLRAQAAGSALERTLSENIREEREDLREAAEQTLNVIVDLNLDGSIRWVSPSWVDVVGTQPQDVQGKPIADLIVSDDKAAFTDAIASMKKDDTRSHRIRFTVHVGPLSKLLPVDNIKEPDVGNRDDKDDPVTLDLEAQGIMVYDRTDGTESHVSHEHCASDNFY
jgi:serine/threonine-protein kinase RIM15